MGISFPVEADFEQRGATCTIINFDTPEQGYQWRHQLPGGGFLGLGVAGRAWAEASLPKRISESNVAALSVPIAVEVLRGVYEEAQKFCTPREHDFEDSKVVRLDLVRDFDDVKHAPELFDGLASVRRDNVRWKVRRWQDAERNMAETVRVGPRAWGGTLYDKHRESPEHAAPGRVRFETRTHSDQLTSVFGRNNGGHVRVVADLESAKCGHLTRAWFERCAFDREVSAMASVAEAVRNAEGLSERERYALWAYLTMPGAPRSMSRMTERKYRRFAKALGVVPGAVALEMAYVARLDFDTATEVIRAA